MYTIGMLKNLELSKTIYPDWKVYVYYNNTVPIEMIDRYKEFDCELFDMSDHDVPGMFWRFFPHEGVERFISRDSDSRLSMREKHAVDEWVDSGETLHVMRDHPHHDIKIYGGMFGLKIDNNFKLEDEINKWIIDEDRSLFNRNGDVKFLKNMVYKKYEKENDILSHDSCFNQYPFTKSFPTKMENFNFVGEIFNEKDKRSWQYSEWINREEI